ncbi:MAG: VanW family protein [Clostridia bacterium]|nr:VanW family protein [Clostridia bacterium]
MYEKRGEPKKAGAAKARTGAMRNGTVQDFSVRQASGSRAGSGSSRRPPASAMSSDELRKRQEAKKRRIRKRRIQFISILIFFLLAIGGLIFAVIFAVNSCNSEAVSTEPTASPSAEVQLGDDSMLSETASVNGISIGGKTVSDARAELSANLQLPEVAFLIQGEGLEQTLNATDIGLEFDIDTAIEQANQRGAVSAQVIINEETLLQTLYGLNENLPNHATNASFTIETDSNGKSSFVYSEGQNGVQLNYDTIVSAVKSNVEQGTYTATIVPEATVSEPAVTVDDLKKQTTLLAEYTTTYRFKGTSSMTEDEKANCEARDINIRKAAEMMSVITLEPGSVFSFNNTTGKRSAQNGWAEAKAVYGGGYRLETGGGVCQVSTTMFNALIRANVEIVNRKGHTIPSDYVTTKFEQGLGFDATVDYGNIDFKFRNNGDTTLYVFVYVTTNKESSRKRDVNVEVYGQAFEEGVSYRTRNEILEHIESVEIEYIEDKDQEAGTEIVVREGHDFYLVMSYVDKYVNGEFVETVMSFESEYPLILERRSIGPAIATPSPDSGGSSGGGGDGELIPVLP